MMNVIDIYASVAWVILGMIAPLSIFGSLILSIGGVISAMRGKRFRAPEQIYMWGVGCLFFGVSGLISIAISDQINVEKTIFLEISIPQLWLMFAVSALLLTIGKVLEIQIRRRTFAKSPRYIKSNRW